MKKFFSFLGLITLICFSFFYTAKTVSVVKEFDDIMIDIKNIKEDYYVEPVNATIKDNEIIPGISGVMVDIETSYYKMKEYGKFNKNLLEFKSIKPEISIIDNKNKYITSGNKSINNVSLIFDSNIETINEIALKNNVSMNYLIDSEFFDNNNDLINKLVKNNNFIIDAEWPNTVLKSLGQNNCYELKNDFKKCYSIKPKTISKLTNLSISNGDILLIKIKDNKKIDYLIKSILSKGFNIVTLDELVTE